ncbi:dipeptidase, putative [Talaromyces stipitatus ATCC 10500]|uniref:Putative dipeptidase TSTA_079200 n=1 Tax=Talaromyces stipitatus (strain ATCC 10500 / CBS 375.48 / QM 6759 / NRRL 1006) TaxID=441959 RepID=DPEP2_TALSN|nr:dipeptidase, putative [Talaromyces stipitatus ATCC 10500]B8LWT1.1 RecName: Full=Putative dipeptidase TSTA_079200 [Talaromyces stipitatus ATCC 10500]EED24564.1 dipeptidase, putative [Talaromyces stipitatus ATCC 10500]
MATLNTRGNDIALNILSSTTESSQAVVLSRARGSPNSQRAWLFGLGTLGIILASVLLNPFTSTQESPLNIDPTDYAARTKHILSTTPLIDGHNDLPYLIRTELKHQIYNDRFTFNTGLLSNTDRKKLRDGMVGGQFWSAYIHCPKDSETNKDVPLDEATWTLRDTLEQIDITKRFVDEFPDLFQFCSNSSCAREAFANGKIGSFIGIEGAHQIGNSLASLRQLYDLGARYITTTHNCDNVFGTAASTVSAGGEDKGLTLFGEEYVAEMNRLGMMLDLSHVSHETMRDTLRLSEAPVIFSHTGAYALSKTLRFAPDDVLKATAEKGGIIMITFINRFLRPDDPDAATIHDVVDHIWHVAQVAGWDHVGVGSDFDGTPVTPRGLEDVSKYPRLVELLMERGATDDQIRKFAGDNILRVWSEVEKAAERIQVEGRKPNEAIWEGRTWVRSEMSPPIMFRDSIGRRIPSYLGEP